MLLQKFLEFGEGRSGACTLDFCFEIIDTSRLKILDTYLLHHISCHASYFFVCQGAQVLAQVIR